jgi:hypothetical protein
MRADKPDMPNFPCGGSINRKVGRREVGMVFGWWSRLRLHLSGARGFGRGSALGFIGRLGEIPFLEFSSHQDIEGCIVDDSLINF